MSECVRKRERDRQTDRQTGAGEGRGGGRDTHTYIQKDKGKTRRQVKKGGGGRVICVEYIGRFLCEFPTKH